MSDVYVSKMRKKLHNQRSMGLFCDIGAPKSVTGLVELNGTLNSLSFHDRQIRPSVNSFRIAYTVYQSMGKITIPLHTPTGIPNIPVELYIVEADIPAFLGPNVLEEESLAPYTVSDRLKTKVPVKRAGENMYMDL